MTFAASSDSSAGPLTGLRVVELTGIGPGPHCAMLLADLGAEVLRIDRPGGNGWPNPVVDRGRHSIELDLHAPAGRERCLAALDKADILIEGYRPCVMERLGLGPDVVLARNPKLVYGRMTGWGQTGPRSARVGHDINFIALTGALAAMGKADEPPLPPLNLVGDFGGGSMMLAFGIMAALWERERSGLGQVIDAAIIDGTSSLMALLVGAHAAGAISLERDRNLLAGVAPFYRCYRCADGKDVAIGAIEPPFYAELIRRMGAPSHLVDEQGATEKWGAHCQILEAIFLQRTRAEWQELLDDHDVCFTPVLTVGEAMVDPHIVSRGGYRDVGPCTQNAPVPRFSRTPGAIGKAGDGEKLLQKWSQG
ncbi:CaiB/BaiF CoA transferase family protein [Sphingobium subterraneum]|uniref:Alpha-methylacyl-CoA racemase n=1 Tax=Sphingobium subterraneum TaxID=627688 RepID=A0A841J3E1_9SPHN|nr:CaiB/BaiF CoA-transferase family protein [Sphingobium subterraneum]MBB6125304.1 alpha-methylacyl-CoA racemase [Sphingobium subterraneum]